ncbi:hypothetical protein ACFV2Q_31340 [Streptomyces sp. NPDC059650]|uniref:nSTAND1 domain-containing NTPase n=1 Tax=Streptomyces sp. NPDC059650 TaxID=3346896 RepID=UPI0036A8566D
MVLGVRADFYGHCVQDPRLVEAMRDAQVAVGPMSSQELREAITPAGHPNMPRRWTWSQLPGDRLPADRPARDEAPGTAAHQATVAATAPSAVLSCTVPRSPYTCRRQAANP